MNRSKPQARFVEFITTDNERVAYSEDTFVRTSQRVEKRAGDVSDTETVRIKVFDHRTKRWIEHFATRAGGNFRNALQRIDGDTLAVEPEQARCVCGYTHSDHKREWSPDRRKGPCAGFTPAVLPMDTVQPAATQAPATQLGAPTDTAELSTPARTLAAPAKGRRTSTAQGWVRILVKPGRIALDFAPWVDGQLAAARGTQSLEFASCLCDGNVRIVRETNAIAGGSFSVESREWLFVSDTQAAIANVSEFLTRLGFNVQQ